MPQGPHERHPPTAPPVRVEVRHGSTPPVAFDVAGDEFLIGSVAGCDLRIPGANLPQYICLIRRGPDGVGLRKLAPALPILHNGSPLGPTGHAVLRHGDVVSVGAVDLHMVIGEPGSAAGAPAEVRRAIVEVEVQQGDWERRHRELETRARALEEQAKELEADRVLWYERRLEIEREIKAAREELDQGRRRPDAQRPPAEAELRARIQQEVAAEYRVRREELEQIRLTLREAAVQLKERKQKFEDSLRDADPQVRELVDKERAVAAREQAVAEQAADLARQRDAFEADRRVNLLRAQQAERDLARHEVDLGARELAARELAAAAAKDREQYQADLVRIDRLSAALEAKERSLEQRAAEIDRRHEQFQQDTRDFEEQLQLFDEREERAKSEDARLAARQAELDAREGGLNRRLAEVEVQQATLVALRTRLEHLRDELRAQEARLADERARTEEESRQAQERLEHAEVVRHEVETEKDGHAESQRLFDERSALMAQAVERLRGMHEQIEAEGARLRKLEDELALKSADQAEQAGLLKARAEQLLEAQERVEADRLALRERDAALRQAEEAREALQEQLRLRSEELATRQCEIDVRARQLDDQARELAEQIKQLEDLRADATSARQLTEEEAAGLARRDEQMRAAEQTIADQKQLLDEAHARFEQEQADAEERLARARAEIEELKDALSVRTNELISRMPDLEERAQAAIDRTAQARETLRAQLGELHAYALKSQEDLESVRTQVEAELGRLRDQEQALGRARSEHRLAVSSFRQQLIEWQGRFGEMKQALHHGESRLERREKQVEATEQELSERAGQVRQQEQEVTEKRTEVDRHLGDMQAWFRQKFREIAETRWSRFRGQGSADNGQEPGVSDQGSGHSGILQMPPRPADGSEVQDSAPESDQNIIPLPDDLDPADRKLGELLRSLNVVDRETLHGLWDEARRQRRTLRQVLLAGGYLTLYQLALIETGNLNGLMLGRFRVIDRMLSTPREAIYRVFDPQLRVQESGVRGQDDGTCLLRHLGEAEMLDAVRPDEYRQRFGAARDLAHPNVAATWEVLDINGRPAVVQEWLHGLPGGEWPAAVGSPGVWHRLLMQAALGLHSAHSAGLTHGRLTADSFVLTRPGVVKLSGVGEPPWLHAGGADRDARPEEDLRLLGQVAHGWMHAGARRRAVRPKPFPAGLLGVLRSLGVTQTDGAVPMGVYPSTAALLEDLDRVSSEVPADQAAWDKLLAYVAENAGDGIVLRQSA